MNKIVLIIGLTSFLSLHQLGFGQAFSSAVLDGYESSVVSQVFDLVRKGDLTESQQIQIASLVNQKDQQIKLALEANSSIDSVNIIKNNFDDQIRAILSTTQKYEIYVANVKENAKHKYTYSQFAMAIRYKEELDISESQESALMTKIGELKEMKNAYYNQNGKSLDTRAFESEEISQILTAEQYMELLYKKNITKAESYAEKNWLEMVQRNLTEGYQKESVIQELILYYVARQSIYNKFEHDLIQQKSEANVLYKARPLVLKMLQKARRSPGNDTLNGSFN